MSEYLIFRSKVTDIYDYHMIDISQFVPDFVPDEAELEKDLYRQRNRHGIKQECEDPIREGDLVTISCKSRNPKYCKEELVIPVGKGLFDPELENKLIGQCRGTDALIMTGGDEVAVKIEKVVRVILPELNDETVSSWGMDGINSVAELKLFCINRQIDKYLDNCSNSDEASAFVWSSVSERSTFVMDEEEEAAMLKIADRQLAESNAKTGDLGNDGIDLPELYHAMFLAQLRLAVVGQEIAREREELFTEEAYEKYLISQTKAHPELSPTQVRERYTVMEFMVFEYGDMLAVELDHYVDSYFKEKLNNKNRRKMR